MSDLFKVSAPTRVDLAGGTTDIWPLYCLLGESSKTINLAVSLCTHVQVECVDAAEFSLRLNSGPVAADVKLPVERNQIPLIRPELQFPAFVVSEAFKEAPALPKKAIHVSIQSGVPLGSGLGGSSSLCVALARAVSRVTGGFAHQGWQWSMLAWVRDVEARFLQTATGTQDYLAALFGGMSCLISHLGRLERIAYSDEVIGEIADRMIVVFSGQMHQSGLSNWEIFRRALEGDKAVLRGLNSINEIASSLDRELRLSRRDWRAVGQLLSAEWRIRRELFKVNTPRLDDILGFLKEQPCLGAKVCGAAAGGSILILADPQARAGVVSECHKKNIEVLECSVSRDGVDVRT